MNEVETASNGPTANLIPYDAWLYDRRTSRVTGWRYRKSGLIATINIFGRVYVSRDEIAKFERRALAGEFSREHARPAPPKKGKGKKAEAAA